MYREMKQMPKDKFLNSQLRSLFPPDTPDEKILEYCNEILKEIPMQFAELYRFIKNSDNTRTLQNLKLSRNTSSEPLQTHREPTIPGLHRANHRSPNLSVTGSNPRTTEDEAFPDNE